MRAGCKFEGISDALPLGEIYFVKYIEKIKEILMRKNIYILIALLIGISSFMLLRNNFTKEEMIEKVLFSIY